ncbi:MAG: HAMP domain-containing protein [Clostridia bacterium]|nr:HAMP domain-containing protein [Clostridia bacterium]
MKKMVARLKKRAVEFWQLLRRTLFSGITLRWLRNVFGAILIASILMVTFFCMFAQNSYYNMVRARLRADAQNLENYYSNYISTESFTSAAQTMVDEFEDTTLMELQISDLSGQVAFSSSGFPLNDMQETPDLTGARLNKADSWIGEHTATGEKIMSYTVPLQDSYGNTQGTLRLLTSLELTDALLLRLYLLAAVIGLSVILLTGFSGVYFIKSIIVPVAQINDIANDIAKGNMTRRIEKYNQDDELGKLCATINAMAKDLGESEKVKNDFISSVSHELRTPLTAIRGWSETMIATQSEEMDATTRRGIEVIYKETERLSKLVEELLDTSRIQNGRFKLMVAPMDVVAEFEDTVFMMMERARLENVIIEYIPEPDSVEILGDKNRLKQVFFNIIDNAVKHSETDGKIETAVTLTETHVCLRIQDHGEGISPQDLPFVKQMFYKGNSQKRGSGIGLGVADEIVRKHGGTLEIESELGVGTTVIISLPLSSQE